MAKVHNHCALGGRDVQGSIARIIQNLQGITVVFFNIQLKNPWFLPVIGILSNIEYSSIISKLETSIVTS